MTQTSANTYFLLTNSTSDGNSASVSNLNYRSAVVKAWGTWGGATIKLQTLAPQSSPETWIDIPDVNGVSMVFTQNRQATLEFIVQNEPIRAVQAGSTGSTTLNVTLEVY